MDPAPAHQTAPAYTAGDGDSNGDSSGDGDGRIRVMSELVLKQA